MLAVRARRWLPSHSLTGSFWSVQFIAAETTITAAELCAAGMWQRVDGGYEVLDREAVELSVEQFRKMGEDREFCQTTGGHEPSDDDPDLCRKCLAWRPTAEDWPAD